MDYPQRISSLTELILWRIKHIWMDNLEKNRGIPKKKELKKESYSETINE